MEFEPLPHYNRVAQKTIGEIRRFFQRPTDDWQLPPQIFLLPQLDRSVRPAAESSHRLLVHHTEGTYQNECRPEIVDIPRDFHCESKPSNRRFRLEDRYPRDQNQTPYQNAQIGRVEA